VIKSKSFFIKGPRLELRGLTAEDTTGAYLAWMNDPEVVRFTESRHKKYTHDELQAYVKTCNESGRDYLFGIFESDNACHVGNIKIGLVDPRYNTANVGLIIGEKKCWGQGYATEAIRLILEFAFEKLGLAKLNAGVIAGNMASQRAFEKNGFVVEGVRRKQNLFEGERRDEILLGLLRGEWQKKMPKNATEGENIISHDH
jgi:RimJ/RimL family protein N-acetyltransferase